MLLLQGARGGDMSEVLAKKFGGVGLKVGGICLGILVLSFLISTLIGSLNLGCVRRYASRDASGGSYDVVSSGFILNSNGMGYNPNTGVTTYGNWYSTGVRISANIPVHMQISGTVKLCKAKLPAYNPEKYSANGGNYGNTTDPIFIPTIGSDEFLTIVLDAKNGNWANIAQIDLNDQILVQIQPQYTVPVSYHSAVTGSDINADCSPGNTSYSPVCGLYTSFPSGQYTYAASCSMSAYCKVSTRFFWKVHTEMGSFLQPYVDSTSLVNYSTDLNDLILYYPYPVCDVNASGTTNFEGGNCNNIPPFNGDDSYTDSGSSSVVLKSAYANVCNNYCSCRTSDTCNMWVYEGAISDYVCLGDVDGFCAIYGRDTNVHTHNKCYHNNEANRCWNQGRCGAPHWENLFRSGDACGDSGNVIDNVTVRIDPDLNSGYSNNAPKRGFQSLGGNQSFFSFTPLTTSKFWYSANTATALLYRFDSNLQPTSASNLGAQSTSSCVPGNAGYCFASISAGDASGTILSTSSPYASTQYLQYRLLNNTTGDPSKNTGGYVLKIQQDKCVRYHGQSFTGSDGVNRGGLKYVILPDGETPTADDIANAQVMDFQNAGGGQYKTQFTSTTDGLLWMIVENAAGDYQNSTGQYNLDVLSASARVSFNGDILTPLLIKIRSVIMNTSMTMFKNMTCYNLDDKSKCFDFFLYVKALMTLYVTVFALMFTVGIVKITAEDLVIRFIRLGFVAGLLNGSTFVFFHDTVYPMVTIFVDQIISNIQGYNLYDSQGHLNNPFMFLEDIMTNIFLGKILSLQYLALFSFGFSGVFYFFVLFFFLIVFLMTIVRAIATYLMAFVANAFMLSLAPIFITFILFEKTRSLFDAWVKAIFRFMMEPVVLLAGVIVLTQLFEMILDNLLNFSVCWKCAIPFGIPSKSLLPIPGMHGAPMFCIYWFAPWGYDYRSSVLGMNFQYIVQLGMVSFCLYGYPDFASKLTKRLTNASGGAASATGAGAGMANAMINATGLKKAMPNFQGIANRSLGLGLRGLQVGGKFLKNGGKLPTEAGEAKSKIEDFISKKMGGAGAATPAAGAAKGAAPAAGATPAAGAGATPAAAAGAPAAGAGTPAAGVGAAAGTPAAGVGAAAAGTPAAGTPAAGTPAAGAAKGATPAAGAGATPAAGTPAAGTPAAGTPAAGTPAAGTPAAGAGGDNSTNTKMDNLSVGGAQLPSGKDGALSSPASQSTSGSPSANDLGSLRSTPPQPRVSDDPLLMALASVRAQGVRLEQMSQDSQAAAKASEEKAAKEKEAKEKAAKEKEAKEKEAKEKAAKEPPKVNEVMSAEAVKASAAASPKADEVRPAEPVKAASKEFDMNKILKSLEESRNRMNDPQVQWMEKIQAQKTGMMDGIKLGSISNELEDIKLSEKLGEAKKGDAAKKVKLEKEAASITNKIEGKVREDIGNRVDKLQKGKSSGDKEFDKIYKDLSADAKKQGKGGDDKAVKDYVIATLMSKK